MAKLSEAMKFLQLKQVLDQERVLTKELRAELERAEQDRDLLATALIRSDQFQRWLLTQDTSSMLRYRSWVNSDLVVEDADDLTMALAFAGRAG